MVFKMLNGKKKTVELDDDDIEESESADKGEKVTVYHVGPAGGLVSVEGYLNSVSAHGVKLIPKRGKRVRMIMSYYSSFWMVVKGWGNPRPNNPERIIAKGNGAMVTQPKYGGVKGTIRHTDDFMSGEGKKLKSKTMAIYKNKKLQTFGKVPVEDVPQYESKKAYSVKTPKNKKGHKPVDGAKVKKMLAGPGGAGDRKPNKNYDIPTPSNKQGHKPVDGAAVKKMNKGSRNEKGVGAATKTAKMKAEEILQRLESKKAYSVKSPANKKGHKPVDKAAVDKINNGKPNERPLGTIVPTAVLRAEDAVEESQDARLGKFFYNKGQDILVYPFEKTKKGYKALVSDWGWKNGKPVIKALHSTDFYDRGVSFYKPEPNPDKRADKIKDHPKYLGKSESGSVLSTRMKRIAGQAPLRPGLGESNSAVEVDDFTLELAGIKPTRSSLEEAGMRITGKGLQAAGGKDLQIQANTIYYIGASSSPTQIMVTGISGDRVEYQNYPFGKQGSKSGVQTWIFKDLAAQGISTWLRTYGKYQPKLAGELKSLLAGKKIRPNGARYAPYEVEVENLMGDKDPWYALEKYGSVGGMGDNKYSVRLQKSSLDDLKKDSHFKVLKTKKL